VLWKQPQVPLQAKLFIDSALAAWKSGAGFSYFGEAKDTGQTLARIEARSSRRRRSVGEIGMLIAPSVWKQGLATELTYFGLWYCFENLEFEAVSIDAGVANEASNRLLTGLGLHLLGEQDFPLAEGGCARLNRYVLTRDEFRVQLLPVLGQFDYCLPPETPGATARAREHGPAQTPSAVGAKAAAGSDGVRPVGEIGLVASASPAAPDAANDLL